MFETEHIKYQNLLCLQLCFLGVAERQSCVAATAFLAVGEIP